MPNWASFFYGRGYLLVWNIPDEQDPAFYKLQAEKIPDFRGKLVPRKKSCVQVLHSDFLSLFLQPLKKRAWNCFGRY